MKFRLSYFFISAIIILSILTGIFIWRIKHNKEITLFNKQLFSAPISSRYIPRDADLVLHWKVSPNKIPSYVENYQNKSNKNKINQNVRLIRDSSFNLIGIDFSKEISKWAGDFGSFAIFNSYKKVFNDWIIVLDINNDIDIIEELESISDNNVTESNLKDVYKSKIFSKKTNTNDFIYFATKNNNVLIASDPDIIQSSINKAEKNKIHTKENYKYIKLIDNVKDGFLLLEMSPKKILNSLGQKENILELDKAINLISSINLENNMLILEGVLSYDKKTKMPENSPNLTSMRQDLRLFNDLILVDNPSQYFSESSIHPYKKLIASLIKRSTSYDFTNFLKTILANSNGQLIWINDKGWSILAKKSETDKKAINEILKQKSFLNSNIDFENKDLEVWSKISTDINDDYELKRNIEAIFEETEEIYIWSQNLASISNHENKKYLSNIFYSEYEKNEVNDFNEILNIHLMREKTELFLNNFYPYILLKTMLGNKVNFPDSIDISVSAPTINYPDFIKFTINLKTS
tara:strand:- start:546 stop:2111 length:1566 start_codon:yes stop_codon:yes gene_type:complete